MATRFFLGYWKRGKLLWKFLIFICLFSPLYLWIQLQSVVDTSLKGLSEERQVRNEPMLKDELTNGETEIEVIRSHKAVIDNPVKDILQNVSNNVIHKRTTLRISEVKKQSNVDLPVHTTQRKPIRFDNIEAFNLGCYSDVVDKRALRDSFSSDSRRMTIPRCLRQCYTKGFRYAGLEFRSECYCGNILFQKKANESLCHLKCAGDESQFCGGIAFVSIYEIVTGGKTRLLSRDNSKSGYKASTSSPGLADDFMICMTRPTGEFFLRDEQTMENNEMTVQICKDFCTEKGRPIAAVSRGIECHCGYLSESVNLSDGKVKPQLCDTPCPGKVDQFCGGQDTLSIYQTESRDTSCDTMSLRPPGSMPLISLASFPGSGNTWVRYLIERVTGIYTGSYYNDGELSKKGFLGEREPYKKGNTVVVKTHRFDEEHIREFDGGIVIIRNPYDAMLSEHNRKFGGHTGHANPMQYKQGTEWTDFVLGKSRTWTNTALNWLLHQPNIHVVHYEHLKTDIYGELKKIVQFLKLPVNESRLLCVASDPVGKFKRPPAPKGKQLDFDPFTEDMREMVSLYIKSVAMALDARNQEPLPDQYNPKLTFKNDV
ncbi:WSC domain-containing protein 2-like [Anneissia japonica]|uniref:WSC domain-containing protein 2-like n=1 Tax=Anneissia japonica TaxID=1529436 RepID=UPI0014257938|nr:WSC domain-containing protein 2-like [Anneissia japonica]